MRKNQPSIAQMRTIAESHAFVENNVAKMVVAFHCDVESIESISMRFSMETQLTSLKGFDSMIDVNAYQFNLYEVDWNQWIDLHYRMNVYESDLSNNEPLNHSYIALGITSPSQIDFEALSEELQ